jgi:hypothetical protein
MFDLATGAFSDVAVHVDDENLVCHPDLLKVDPAEPRSFLPVELRGWRQGGRSQDDVSGERQLSIQAFELLAESHGAAERDDGVVVARGARFLYGHPVRLATRG